MLVTLAAIVLIVVLLGSWVLTVFNLPGNWIMVGASALYALLIAPESRFDVSWTAVAVLCGLAVAGEIVESAAGAVGASRSGGSRRGMLLAIVGSIAGSILGAIIGLPIPIIGSVVAAILFAALGAMLGAVLGEQWKGRDAQTSWQVGQAAFWGRLFGTLGKITIGSAMVVIAVVAMFLETW
jgi:uncharacterized protein YqgC (DUF456 family)